MEDNKLSRHHYNKTKTTKSSDKSRKDVLLETKKQISALATSLLNQKAINRPLWSKMSLFAFSQPHLSTVTEALHTLQQIEHHSSNGVRSKKYTMKEFKVMKQESNKTFNVYRKYRIWQEKSKNGFVKQQNITEEELETLCEVTERNITTRIKGLYNIMTQVKADIEYFYTYGYIVKVEVLKVVVDKI